MYQRIKQTKAILEQYTKKILADKVADLKYVDEELSKYGSILEEAYKSSKEITSVRNRDWLDSPWDDFFRGKDPNEL
jgi:2-oxoglutarate dehydrogenase E1 component